jgi:hypothetical protein
MPAIDASAQVADAGGGKDSAVAPTPPTALILNADCLTAKQYGNGTTSVKTELDLYAEVSLGSQVNPRSFAGATAWLCDYSPNGTPPNPCDGRVGCKVYPKPAPTCTSAPVEISEPGPTGGPTMARVKCGYRFTDTPNQLDYGWAYLSVKITIAL